MRIIFFFFALIFVTTPGVAEYYDLTITRTGHNTYYVDDWSDATEYWEVITEHCYVDAYEDEAILWYSWSDYDHYLYFPNGKSCSVEKALDIVPYY